MKGYPNGSASLPAPWSDHATANMVFFAHLLILNNRSRWETWRTTWLKDRQTDGQMADSQTDEERQTDKQTVRWTDIHKWTDRQTDRQNEWHYQIPWPRSRSSINVIRKGRKGRHIIKSDWKHCNLCLWEKYYIITANKDSTLNSRTELVSTCRHKRKFLLSEYG